MLKQYLALQLTLLKRKIEDNTKINIIIITLIVLASFIAFSIFLFKRTEYAQYIYILLSLYFIIPLSELQRNDFLKSIFTKKDYTIVRISENLIITAPFVLFMFTQKLLLFPLMLTIFSSIISQINFKFTNNITIPTPFYKKPFEFIIGFRYSFFLFIAPCIFIIMAIIVDNFNLMLFTLLSFFIIVLHYYLKHEDDFFIWIYNLSPKMFLIEKIKTAFLHTFYLYFPVLIIILFCYPEKFYIPLLVIIIGNLFLATFILVKYSSYPNEISLLDTFLFIISLALPVAILLIFPYFYKKSIGKLKGYLW